MFSLDWSQILVSTPWFALAAYLFGGEEQLSRRVRIVIALVWGFIFSWIFWWAVSVIASPFPWNVIGIIVGWISGISVAIAPFVALWRLFKFVRTRASRA